ncbi:hypothetical protein C1701_08885 [Actinoalloteichus sp. AHMU CJ021]|uniref:ESX-1 secretion-associated protein n=1 Tax=Actinoalloteichus caeruleus DSM 43889 TaxID=1120930 RepID=A0ABT1JLF1_ACTCY|nr:hypothetical protein [Actinoalloteichus caeruleus]AUS78464.1 hypothetical protein C1701_08885 [Actinoalloteichus sp. AHMU CJ021]MCP2332561.1 hypothetical protein [Actinoalloteichus caeruleus DSM 43889]
MAGSGYELDDPDTLITQGPTLLNSLAEDANTASEYAMEHIMVKSEELGLVYGSLVEFCTQVATAISGNALVLRSRMEESATAMKAAGEDYAGLEESEAARIDATYSPEHSFDQD